MARRRRTVTLTDYHALIDSVGEIRVGAFARRQRRNRIIVAALGLALIGGAIALYATLRPKSHADRGGEYPVRVRCITCNHEAEQLVSSRETFPLVCPQCNERSCKVLWRCRHDECGFVFIPDETEERIRCPKCKRTAVGSAADVPNRP